MRPLPAPLARLRPLARPLRFLLESLATTLVPAPCAICAEPLLNLSRTPVCTACLAAIRPTSGRTCEVCGEHLLALALPHPYAPTRCAVCLRYQQPYRRAVSYGGYQGELRDLLHLLKFSGIQPAATQLGRLLALAIAQLQPELATGTSTVLVMPVPLHASKRRARGFNQSDVIVKSALRHLPRQGFAWRYAPDALVRARATESQTGLTGHQRRVNLRGAFVVSRQQSVRGARVLLVDDIFTTGSTVSECARTLRAAGAEAVWVATIARVQPFSAAELDRWNLQGVLEEQDASPRGETLQATR